MFRIKEVLREKGISQIQLANMLGKTPQYVSGIIREVDGVSISALASIAKVLNVPLASLFDDYKTTGSSLVCPNCGARLKLVQDEE